MQRNIIRPASRKTPFVKSLLLSTVLVSGLVAPAMAQTAPEQFRANDEHGVDLATGTYNLEFTQGSIGPAEGGVAVKYYLGRGGAQDNWSGLLYKTMEGSTNVIDILFGSVSERFTKQGSVWVAAKAGGATLVEIQADLQYTFKTSDGRTILYKSPKIVGDPSQSYTPTVYGCENSGLLSCAMPVESLEPNGSKYTLNWDVSEYCNYPQGGGGIEIPEDGILECDRTFRLSDVRSNSSYGVKFTYQSDQSYSGNPPNQGPPPTSWYMRSGLKFFDLSEAYCDPSTTNCNNVTSNGAIVTYANPSSGVNEITNSNTGTWRIERTATQYKIRSPGASADTTVVNIAANGKVSSITERGETKSYVWGTSSGGNPQVTTTDGVGASNTVTIPPVTLTPRPVSEVDGLGQTTAYAYDGNNRLTREIRPEGDYTNYTYDARGNITETRAVAKSGSSLADIVSTANFDAACTYASKCNKPNYTIDPRGNRTDYTYDLTTGELTRLQMPAATGGGTRPEVNYVYSMLSAQIKDSGGNMIAQPAQAKLTQVTACATAATCAGSANETKITLAYNTPNLLPTSVTTAAGNNSISSTVAYAYDARDNLATIDGPLPGSNDTVTYIYDSLNRRRGVIGADPDGGGSRPRSAERYTFDAESRVIKAETGTATAATEAALNAMTVAQTVDNLFDANGNKIKEVVSGTAGVTQVVQLAYDADNRLSCTALRMNPAIFASLPSSACTMGTAGTGGNDFGADRITQNTYDANGRVTLVKTAVGAAEQANEVATGYTANGQTAFVIDAESNRTGYVYDGHDRLWKTQYPSATKGANAVNASDYEQLTFDANSNVTSRRLRDGQNIAYAYDNLGRVVTKDVPNIVYGEKDITYTYDLLGRVLSGVDSTSVHTTLTYDALGRNTAENNYYSGKALEYDAAGRMVKLTWQDGVYINYDYDITGQVSTIRENGATSGVGILASYAYDNLGRRSSVTFGNGVVQSYTFDAAQRLSTLASNLGGTAQDQTATLSYNPAGQIDTLSKSNDAYAWAGHYNVDRLYGSNGLNQLTATTPGGGQVSVPTLTYDARGNLTGSGSNGYTYTSENRMATAPSTSLYYEPFGRLISSTAGTRFDYHGPNLVTERDGSNAIVRRYVHGPGTDNPIVWYEGTGLTDKRWLTADERGSITAITNASGAAIQLNAYDEYGIPAASNLGRFQYTGQTWLPELGMFYYKARIYSPTLGRFMQSDPIGYGDGMNFYNYVGSDPINFVDPTGLEASIGANGEKCFTSYTYQYSVYRNSEGIVNGPLRLLSQRTVCAGSGDQSGGLGGGGGGSSSKKKKPKYKICKGRARVLAGNPRLQGRTGGMLRPLGAGSAAVIPRQWDPKAPSTGRSTAFLREQGAGVGGVTAGGQGFSGLDDVMGEASLGTTGQAQDIIMSRNPDMLIIELLNGRDEGIAQVTIAIPIASGLSCPTGTSFTGNY